MPLLHYASRDYCLNDVIDSKEDKVSNLTSNPSCGLASDGFLSSDIGGNDSMNDSDMNGALTDSDYEGDEEDLADDPGTHGANPISSPLYDNAEITVFESHLLCFQFSIKHSLTSEAFSELLQLLTAHLPSSSMAPKSIYRLKSFFVDLFPHASPTIHPYCAVCLSLLSEEGFCSTEGCQAGEKEEFISIALAPQLRRIFEGIADYVATTACYHSFLYSF